MFKKLIEKEVKRQMKFLIDDLNTQAHKFKIDASEHRAHVANAEAHAKQVESYLAEMNRLVSVLVEKK